MKITPADRRKVLDALKEGRDDAIAEHNASRLAKKSDDECQGCFGQGTGKRCCVCGGLI